MFKIVARNVLIEFISKQNTLKASTHLIKWYHQLKRYNVFSRAESVQGVLLKCIKIQ